MEKAYIDIARKWAFVFAHDIGEDDLDELSTWLDALGASRQQTRKAMRVIMAVNTGLTFSSDALRMSVVCIGRASSREQYMNTVAHEVTHLASDIGRYYDVDPDSEEMAYLHGYLFQCIVEASGA